MKRFTSFAVFILLILLFSKNFDSDLYNSQAVRIDNKQRLGLLEEDGELWIRANQGHSVKVRYLCSKTITY